MAVDSPKRHRARRLAGTAGALFACAALSALTAGAEAPAPAAGDTRPPVAASDAATAMPASPAQASELEASRQPVSEPDGYRMDDYRQPVPATLAGATVITTEQAEAIWKEKSAVFIDVFPKAPKPPNLPAGTVWRDPRHMSIEGGRWLPNVGQGMLAPELEGYFRSHLETFTGGDKTKPIVFYCLKDCWMSWNAGKRALSWGYTNVIWFPDGTDGWTEAGNDIVYLTSEPGP